MSKIVVQLGLLMGFAYFITAAMTTMRAEIHNEQTEENKAGRHFILKMEFLRQRLEWEIIWAILCFFVLVVTIIVF